MFTRGAMGVELETIGEMKGDGLNDQVEDETDFVEVLALETEHGQRPDTSCRRVE